MTMKGALRPWHSSKFRMISSRRTVKSTDRRGKNPSGMVRAFCKRHRICVTCRHHWTVRGTTRCEKCIRAHSKYQKSRTRRNYECDVKASVCVRCHKRPATATNKRCPKCQATTLPGSGSVMMDSVILQGSSHTALQTLG